MIDNELRRRVVATAAELGSAVDENSPVGHHVHLVLNELLVAMDAAWVEQRAAGEPASLPPHCRPDRTG